MTSRIITRIGLAAAVAGTAGCAHLRPLGADDVRVSYNEVDEQGWLLFNKPTPPPDGQLRTVPEFEPAGALVIVANDEPYFMEVVKEAVATTNVIILVRPENGYDDTASV